jgi:predicted TIM-barrel fold metal-dependent hydrolase
MKRHTTGSAFVFLSLVLSGTVLSHGKDATSTDESTRHAVASLARLQPIDAHAHIYDTDPSLTDLLTRLNLHLLNILVIDNRDTFFKALEPQFSDAMRVEKDNPERFALCTTFSPYDFDSPGFSTRVISQLDESFNHGAVAVKIYKTIGMQIKKNNGQYLMPDDPVFDPIYDEIEARNRTVVAHIAEPTSAWEPPNPQSPDYGYYTQHPEEYAYTHPEWPSKSEILRARDHMLEKHPKLRVIGAHLGSMELGVDQMAAHFDRYPNFAVDTAARIPYFMLQPRAKVRAFLIKYQDRVLYGTDVSVDAGTNVAEAVKAARDDYLRDWKYFATDESVEYHGRKVRGLALPQSTLRKLYHDNAVRWIPGILDSAK